MIVGLFLNDCGFQGKDITEPWRGNPGIGGTQFCFAMLMYYLLRQTNYEIVCYHLRNNYLPKGIQSKIVTSELDAIMNAVNDNVDIFILKSPTDPKVFELIDCLKLKTISWAHNYLIGKTIQLHKETKYIRRIVFVGKQEYDRYIDCELIDKSTFIYNMVAGDQTYKRKDIKRNWVTYTGTLVNDKGFHILAKVWKKIINKIPDAELHVIGSGKIYNQANELGKYNIAAPEYEKKFIPYISDANGKILPSIIFHGALGQEKKEIYELTKVGVMNPTARTETFGLSAVEMGLFGIPVCSRKKNGLPDTVIHKQTGLLSHTSWGLAKNIIILLKDDRLNYQYGKSAKSLARSFSPEKIIDQWIDVINEVSENRNPTYFKPTNNFFNNAKILRIVNRKLWKITHITKWISIVEIEGVIRSLVRTLLGKRD